MKFLTPEIIVHEAFLCYVHMCNDQHGDIQNGIQQIGSDNTSLLQDFKHFNNAIWYNQETRVITITQ